MVVIPAWLDQIPQITFEHEKKLLRAIEQCAEDDDWKVSDGSDLSLMMRQRTDILLEDTKQERSIRLAIIQKNSSDRGIIRVDASNLLTVVLVYQVDSSNWRVESDGIRVLNPLIMDANGWKCLIKLFFQH